MGSPRRKRVNTAVESSTAVEPHESQPGNELQESFPQMTEAMARITGGVPGLLAGVMPGVAPAAPAAVAPQVRRAGAAPNAPPTSLFSGTALDGTAPAGVFFSNLRSNVKARQAHHFTSSCVAFISDKNRAGKTAALDAIRLALTGAHPVGPHAADLRQLACDAKETWVVLDGPTSTASFAVPEGGKKGEHMLGGALSSTPMDSSPLLPLSSYRDLLTLGTAKAREELFARFGTLKAVPQPSGLNDSQMRLWSQALAAVEQESRGGVGAPGAMDVVEQLTSAGSWLRSQKRLIGDRARAVEEELATTKAPRVAEPGELERIEAQLVEAASSSRLDGLRAALVQAESQLGACVEAYKRVMDTPAPEVLAQQLAEIGVKFDATAHRAKLAELTAARDEAQKNVRLFTLVESLRKQLPEHGCLVCQTPASAVAHAAQLIAEVSQALKDASAAIAVKNAAVTQAEVALNSLLQQRGVSELNAKSDFESAHRAKAQALSMLKASKAEYDRLKGVLDGMGVSTGQGTAPDVAALRARAEEIRGAEQIRARLHSLQTEAYSLRLTGKEDLRAVEFALGQMLEALVESVRVEAERAVNAWMPPGFAAKLELAQGEKAVCRWAVTGSDGMAHPRGAMSGAELAALTIALALAWSEGQQHRFLLLDDTDLAGFSAQNIGSVLSMVQSAVSQGKLTQAFVAWSRPAEVPASWQTIRV